MSGELAIGIDIGGTKIGAGVVDEDGRVLARRRAETPSTDPAAVLDVIVELVEQLRGEHRDSAGEISAGEIGAGEIGAGEIGAGEIVAVGIGAAGFVDASGSSVLFAPHLPWRDEPLRDAVAGRTGLFVVVENDANASGWAEWRFGAARDEPDVVVVTLGTGIGGAIVIDGEPYRGRFGAAGEFGHMQVVPDGLPCDCGNRGCWEQYASGRVLTRRGRAAAASDTPLGRRLLDAAGGSVDDIHGAHVTAAAQDGDEEATEWLTEVGDWLGVGVANLAAALDPGVVVVGGGLSDAGELLLGPARAAFSRSLTGRGHRPEARIVVAQLGPEAGLVGAADLARVTAQRRRRASPVGRGRSRAAGRSGRSTRRRR